MYQGADNLIVRETLTWGRVTCHRVREADGFVYVPNDRGVVSAFSLGGDTLWSTRLDAYRRVEYRTIEGGPGHGGAQFDWYAPKGTHRGVSLAGIPDADASLVQIGVQDTSATMPGELAGLFTLAYEASSGRQLAAVNDLPEVVDVDPPMVAAVRRRPYPVVLVLRAEGG